MNRESQRSCPSCGSELSGAMEFCPVCMLRGALPGAAESGVSSFEEAGKPTSEQPVQRYEHFELVTGEDGKPVELGRGAMGVTYKAFHINLRCPVTLKVISEQYVGDESAQLRFLREACAAARLRHSNVASVLHLGTTGQNYFYAMGFVEGGAGVGKSTLVNHWLRRMAAKHYRSAELVFGWSFYRQGTSGDASSADEFLDAALPWFWDPDPRLGTPGEKGERLAKLISQRRTLLVLDGLEPLQNPPGPQEGRVREPSLQALLRELAAFNPGLCVITTRLPVADIADHERTSALRRDLEHLSSQAGAQLLRGLGVRGPEE